MEIFENNLVLSAPLVHMWERIQILVDNLLRDIFVSLVLSGQYVPPPILRESIPDHIRYAHKNILKEINISNSEYFRCLTHSTDRDFRDFVILKNIRKYAINLL